MKPTKCKCGETSPGNFYGANKSTCKKCMSRANRLRFIKNHMNSDNYVRAMSETVRDGMILSESHLQQIINTLGVDAVFGKPTMFFASTRRANVRHYEARYCDQHDEPKLILPKKTRRGSWTPEADHNRQVACNRKCAHLRYKKHKGTQITSKTKHNPVILHSHDSKNPVDCFLYALKK